MIGKCAYMVSDWLLSREVIQKEDQELYEYAVYSLLITIAPLAMSIIFGIIMGVFWQSIVLMIPFMTIRKYSGGYHAKKASVCFAISCLVLFCFISVSAYVEYNSSVAFILILVSVISLIVNSPIDSENRRLSEIEKRRYKRIVMVQTLVYLSIFLGLCVINQPIYALCISIGMILAAGLQFPCFFR